MQDLERPFSIFWLAAWASQRVLPADTSLFDTTLTRAGTEQEIVEHEEQNHQLHELCNFL
jgi:hypothetical protein